MKHICHLSFPWVPLGFLLVGNGARLYKNKQGSFYNFFGLVSDYRKKFLVGHPNKYSFAREFDLKPEKTI